MERARALPRPCFMGNHAGCPPRGAVGAHGDHSCVGQWHHGGSDGVVGMERLQKSGYFIYLFIFCVFWSEKGGIASGLSRSAGCWAGPATYRCSQPSPVPPVTSALSRGGLGFQGTVQIAAG